jgi:hypothetical protein
MLGYPYTYGDTKADYINDAYLISTFKGIGGIVLTLTLSSSSASAVDIVKDAAENANSMSSAAKVAFAAMCVAAGSQCTNVANAKNPKQLAVIGCVALASWCAAKASPL